MKCLNSKTLDKFEGTKRYQVEVGGSQQKETKHFGYNALF